MTPSKSTSDEVRCPRGHLTSAKFPFCTECGAELNPQGEDEGVVRCPNGHLVTGGHKFCIECGAPVDAGTESAADLEPEPEPELEPEPQPVADDIAEVEEVRCPKGHLTPAEYPYCIICGSELAKGAAAAAAPAVPARPAPRAKRTVRRRPRRGAETAVPDEALDPEPTQTAEITPPPAAPRRPSRVRRPMRKPVEADVEDEVEDEDDDDFLAAEAPPMATMDEPDEAEEPDEEDEPFLSPVPSYAETDERDESVEHFVHSPTGVRSRPVTAPRFDRQKWLIPVGVGLLAVIALVVLFLIIHRGGGPAAQPTPLPAVSQAPVTAPPTPAAANPNANVPMRVVSSSVHAGPSANTYVASASIRNPTDFTATNVTVTFTLKNAAGAVLGTVTRMIASLPSGSVAPIQASGKDPGGGQPASVDVRAVAAHVTT